MTEAALHWQEYLDASDRDSERFVDAVKMENGRPPMTAPRPRCPLDQLASLGKISGAANDGERMQVQFAARLEASISKARFVRERTNTRNAARSERMKSITKQQL